MGLVVCMNMTLGTYEVAAAIHELYMPSLTTALFDMPLQSNHLHATLPRFMSGVYSLREKCADEVRYHPIYATLNMELRASCGRI